MALKQLAIVIFTVIVLQTLGAPKKKEDDIYTSQQVDVMKLSKRNFDAQVTNTRNKWVSVVHYYKKTDGKSPAFSAQYLQFADDMKGKTILMQKLKIKRKMTLGIFKIGAVNCEDEYDICEREKINQFPTIRIYPTLPVPAFELEGDLDTKAIMNAAGRYVLQNVQEINSTNVHKFTQDNPSVPKILLFTDKKTIPLLYKALSLAFEKKLFFGIVRQEETQVFKDYNIKTTPSVIVVRANEKNTIPYKGEMKYQALFDFLNVYSEAFVPGGENQDQNKPWMQELVPELHKLSSNDVCFKGESGLCVILVSHGAPEQKDVKTFETLLSKTKDHSANYKYMWLNADVHTEFASTFLLQEYPKVVILSPGKRKKFLVVEDGITEEAIIMNQIILGKVYDIINNGDARFTQVKAELPPFAA